MEIIHIFNAIINHKKHETMTKRIFFAALVLCLGAFTCVSCSDDDDKSVASSSDTSVSSSDLIGTWRDWDGTISATITQDNLTVTQGGNPIYSGPWSLTGSTLVTGEKSQQVELLLGKKLFLGTDEINGTMYFLKDDVRGTTKLSDIYGTWYYYIDADEREIRSAITFNTDGTFELIICAWAERYVGTFTYTNDVARLHTTDYYSSRGSSGVGFGPGTLDTKTLEATWWPNPSYSTFGNSVIELPFVAVGDNAYGPFVGLQAYYYKQ